jgi:hypothetical protein
MALVWRRLLTHDDQQEVGRPWNTEILLDQQVSPESLLI